MLHITESVEFELSKNHTVGFPTLNLPVNTAMLNITFLTISVYDN